MIEDGRHYPDGLTPGERRVLDYVRAGTLDAETAVRLGLSVGEVKNRVASIVTKLGLSGRAGLVAAPAPSAYPGTIVRRSWARPAARQETIDFATATGEGEALIDFASEAAEASGDDRVA